MAISNQEKFIEAFSKALNLELSMIKPDLKYKSISQWDSVAHMMLIAELESAFDIILDTDDIMAMNSVAKAEEIVAKYGVKLTF
jgi:acyl carrier protein